MTKRYSQYCPIAHSLELVGERWALLVVRELLDGPKRYTDLLEGLPGIGTNILAGRLRDLEQAGVIAKRKLPPPFASSVYELTEYGRELEEVMYALARWGARSLGPPTEQDALSPGWSLNAARALFDPSAARRVREAYELHVGDELVTIRVDRGRLEVTPGSSDSADAVIETDPATFYELVARCIEPADALARGAVRVEGDPAALDRFLSAFSFAPRTAAA